MTKRGHLGHDRAERTVPDVGRLITFLDAAVAIALTLLVLPLVDRVPEAVRAHEDAAELLANTVVPFGSFALSFYVIWRFWTVHHRVFARAREVGPLLLGLNLVWLLAIVLLPFVTEMVASYGTEPLVVRLYIGLLLVCSASLTAMVVVLRRSAGPDDRWTPAFVAGSMAATVEVALAFALVLVLPGLLYWPLLLLLGDRIVEPLVATVQRRFARRRGEPGDTGR